MYLNASTDKIEIVLGGTVATNQLQWNVSYQDITSSGMTLPQSGGAGLTNNATAVDIVAAPVALTTRQVTQINVYNADTATATVTIQKDVSGTNYVLFRYNITSLDTLSWSREDGWRLVSQAGGVNSLTSNNFLIGDAGNIAVQAPLSGDVTNVIGAVTIANDAVTYAKMQNVSAASRLLGRGSAGGAGDVEEITLGTNLTMSGTTINATGGGVSTIGTLNSQTKSADGAVISGSSLVMQTADGTNPGLVSTGTQTFSGNKTIVGESATVGEAFTVSNLTPTKKLTVANAGRVSLTSDTTVTTQTVSVITTDTTNAGVVLAPNGTGAIMVQAPDGTTTGGIARGTNAVDLQFSRTNANQVAAGQNSAILCGINNRNVGARNAVLAGSGNVINSNAQNSVVLGQTNSVDNTNSFTCGLSNTNDGTRSIAAGFLNTINSSTNNSIITGRYGLSYVNNAFTIGASNFPSAFAPGAAQSSVFNLQIQITGTAQTELLIDGSGGTRAILNIASPGPTNARAWRAQVDVVAIVATAGTGTLLLNECFMGSYHVGIKRVGTTTSLVGAVSVTNEVSDTNMATSVVTIDADDTNEALRIQFTPPTGGTSSATSVIRVVATAYITEVGR